VTRPPSTLIPGGGADALLFKIIAGFMFLLGCTTSVVRWNKINRPVIAIVTLLCAMNLGYSTFMRDGGVFVPSLLYCYSGVMVFGAVALAVTKNKKLVDPDAKTKD
jgi:hypothetical protein